MFLYREVLKKEIGAFKNMIRAKRPVKLPVVFTREAVRKVLLQLEGINWLIGQVLYGVDNIQMMFYFMGLQFNP